MISPFPESTESLQVFAYWILTSWILTTLEGFFLKMVFVNVRSWLIFIACMKNKNYLKILYCDTVEFVTFLLL